MRRRIGLCSLGLCGLGLGVVAVSACGLDAVGDATAPDVVDAVDSGSSNEPDGTIVPPDDDAGADADATPPPADTSCTSSDPPCTPPDGWQPVAMRIGEGSGCPESYDAVEWTEASLVDPQQACKCTAVTADPPRCDKQDNFKIVGGVLCTGLAAATVSIDGSCTQLKDATEWTLLKASPIAPSQGTCTPQCEEEAGHLSSKTVRLCTPSAECRDGACRGAQAATKTDDFVYCFVKDGDIAECPGDTAHVVRRTIGASASVTCSGATCKNDAKCTNPALHLFKDPTCASTAYGTVAVDGSCKELPGKGVAAIMYEATLVSKPALDVQPTASVAYAETKTLCCPKED